MSARAENPNQPATGRPIPSGRVLRWTFRRADEAFVCELGLDRHESAYELRVKSPSKRADDSVEIFQDAIAALMRQAAIERTLVHEGWSLERFEPHRLAA